MVFEPLPRPWPPHNLPWVAADGGTRAGGMGGVWGSGQGMGSAVHRDTRVAGDGARRVGEGLTAPTSSLGIISQGSRLSETLDQLLLPTRSRLSYAPALAGGEPGRAAGQDGLHLRPRHGNGDQKSPFPPVRAAPPSRGRCSETGAGARTAAAKKQEGK